MSYNNKLVEYVNTMSDNLMVKSDVNPIVSASNLNGNRVSIPLSQSKVIQRALCTASYTPSSAYGNMLSSASQVDFNIKLSTVLSNAYDIALHFTILNNTGGLVELYPVVNWFNRIEIRFNSSIIQQWYTSDLYHYLWVYIDQEWRRVSDLFNLDDRFLPNGDTIANGLSQEFILLLPQNIFRESQMFCPALNIEFVLRLYMNPQNQIIRTGAAPLVSNMYLEFITSHVAQDDVARTFNLYRSGNFQLRYSWLTNQTIPSASMQPSTRYEFLMSSFTGIYNYVQFCVQPANALGLQLIDSRKIASFDVLDENGLSYFNNNSLQSDTESLIWDTMVNPFTRFDEVKNVYKYPFSLTARDDLLKGTLGGFMPLNGRSRLVIETGPAATAKVITWTQSAVPASGNFRICYTYFGETQYTQWLAFNAAAATIEAAIEALDAFRKYDQQVTVSGPLTGGVAVTCTYSATQQLAFDEYDSSANLIIESMLVSAAPADIYVDSVITTAPVDGWNTASYNIIIMGTQVRYLQITEQGSCRVSES